jgi:hypothetical protein
MPQTDNIKATIKSALLPIIKNYSYAEIIIALSELIAEFTKRSLEEDKE